MKKRKISLFLSFYFLCFLLFSCENEKTVENNEFSKVRSFIISNIESGEIPSVSVAVSKGGKIIWMEAFGWADKENKIKATTNTLYCLRSISKTITATGLMTLVNDGKISLYDTLDKYIELSHFPGFEENVKKITIKNLLNHTSGLAMHFYYYYIG